MEFNSVYATGLLLDPLQTLENQMVFDVIHAHC